MKQSGYYAIGKKYQDLINFDQVLWIPDNPYIDERLSGHADLSLFFDGEVLYASNHLNSIEFHLKTHYLNEIQEKKYPRDVLLNACRVGNKIIANFDTLCQDLTEHLKAGKWHLIPVKQGYASCCTLVIDENSIITSDSGIAEKAINAGIEVLKISPGYIDLPGFDYGFIGGSGFMMGETTIALTGHLHHHPDEMDIIDFILGKGKKIRYLSERPIFDIGGAIYLPFSAVQLDLP